MKTPILLKHLSLFLTFLLLIVTNFTFAQKNFSEYALMGESLFSKYQALVQSRLSGTPVAESSFTGDPYLYKVPLEYGMEDQIIRDRQG